MNSPALNFSDIQVPSALPVTVKAPAPTTPPASTSQTFYIEGGTGNRVTDLSLIDPTKAYTQSGTGTQISGAQLKPSPVATNTVINPPPIAPIGNPATPPTQSGAGYTPPSGTAATVANEFNTSLSSTLATQ